MAKLWTDLTTNPATGRYSQKRIATLTCLLMFVFLVLASVVELHLHGWQDWSMRVREPNTELIIVVLAGAMGTSGLTLAGHYFSRKTRDSNGAPLTPPYTENVNEDEANRTGL